MGYQDKENTSSTIIKKNHKNLVTNYKKNMETKLENTVVNITKIM